MISRHPKGAGFVSELRASYYDIVGISSIIVNVAKSARAGESGIRGPSAAERVRRCALGDGEVPLAATNHQVSARIRDLRLEIQRELGAVASAVARVAGPVALWTSRREARRFPRGRPLEPRSFVERRLRSA